MGNSVNIYERLFKLWASICKMIVAGVRDPYVVAEVLQGVVNQGILRLPATDGTATLEDNRLHILDFAEHRDFGDAIPGSPTPATRASVRKMPAASTYRKAFLRFGNLESLLWQESQIVVFAEHWSAVFNNGHDSRETHFLCRRSKGICVAQIGSNEGNSRDIHYTYLYSLDDEPVVNLVDGERDLRIVLPVALPAQP